MVAASGHPLRVSACSARWGQDHNTQITIHPLPKLHNMGITATLNTGNNILCPVPLKYKKKCHFKEFFSPSSVHVETPWLPSPCSCTRGVTPQRPPLTPVPVGLVTVQSHCLPLCQQTLPVPEL